MDLVQEMLKYADVLYKKALQLSGNEADADDLVQETYLNALIAINKGANIKNIKSYLIGVMKNKYFDIHRKNYSMRNSNLFNIDLSDSESYILGTGLKKDELTNAIRKELAYLPKIYREVLVQYYLEKKSVCDIASNLNISSCLVKKRLERGRGKIKEGVIKMEPLSVNSFNPDHLFLYASGKVGNNFEPVSVITNMIDQNVLILAYEKPISIKTISEKLGISTIFAEEAVDKLVTNELMKSEGSKVYTNFPIIDDEFMLSIIEVQKMHVNSTFKETQIVFNDLIEEYRRMNLFTKFNDVQLYLYSLYSVFTEALFHLFDKLNLLKLSDYPERPNGGKWVIDYGYKRNRIDSEVFIPMYRWSIDITPRKTHKVYAELWDTYLSVSPWRSKKTILNDIGELLYCISVDEYYGGVKEHLVPDLTRLGFISKNNNGELKSNIPVISHEDFEKVKQLNHEYAMKYMDIFGDDLLEMIRNNNIIYPKQINPVTHATQLISVQGIALAYAEKANKEGIIKINKDANYPVALIIEKNIINNENNLSL